MKKFVAVILILILGIAAVTTGNGQYAQAEELFAKGEYARAAELYEKMGDYRDSAKKAQECRYLQADAAFAAGDYTAARDLFAALGDYQDSESRYVESRQAILKQRAGVYQLVSISNGEKTLTPMNTPMLKDAQLILNEYGGGSLILGGAENLIWDDATIVTGEGTSPYTVEGDTLTITVQGAYVMVFSRLKEE